MTSPLLEILGDLIRGPMPDRCLHAVPGLALGTTKGPVRGENQDRAVVLHVRRGATAADFLIVAISDGMGGMVDGAGAASLAISTFVAYAAEAFAGGAEDLEEAAHEANAMVHDAYRGEGGATLTAAVFTAGGDAFLVHCGDSRLYVSATDGAFSLLTRDETPAGLLAGVDLESELSSELIEFVGVGARYDPRIAALEPAPGATWLLTTDGAHMIGRKNLRRLVEGQTDAGQAAQRLIDAAEDAGAWDNATVVVACPDRFWRNRAPSDSVALTAWTPAGEVELG